MSLPISDTTASTELVPTKLPKFKRRPFSSQYREKVFYIWYNHGKPGGNGLLPFILPEMDEWNRLPTVSLLSQWITDEYKPRAEKLDLQVQEKMDALVVHEKVEMLRRHAELGKTMQDLASEFLNEYAHDSEIMSASAAVRLLVEGVRIERESRGIPDALSKMQNMSDEQLMDEVKKLMVSSSVTLEDMDANSG